MVADVAADLARRVGATLLARKERLATAESCTGGWVAQELTAIPGSSAWFECGFITYSNTAKMEMLGVPSETLARYGAVSEATALAMATGALTRSHAQWAVAITGVAGPGGGSPETPVGMVCFAWAGPGEACAVTRHFQGERMKVRRQSVEFVLSGLLRQCTF
jgi:nicotinamide-nucleotide amidase